MIPEIVWNMEEDEQSYRVETPEEGKQGEEKKKGLFKPLPSTQQTVSIDGKEEPIVTFFGIEIRERRRDLLFLILTPTLASLIDAAIIVNSYTAIGLQVEAGVLLLVCFIIALPVGLTQSSSGRALLSGLVNTVIYMIIYAIFIASPSFFVPDYAPLNESILIGIAVTLPQIVVIMPACIMGVFFGHIIREVF
jgi:hypothetical protein